MNEQNYLSMTDVRKMEIGEFYPVYFLNDMFFKNRRFSETNGFRTPIAKNILRIPGTAGKIKLVDREKLKFDVMTMGLKFKNHSMGIKTKDNQNILTVDNNGFIHKDCDKNEKFHISLLPSTGKLFFGTHEIWWLGRKFPKQRFSSRW